MPSNSNGQHCSQHHRRLQNHLVPTSPAESLLSPTHCKVTPNTNVKLKVKMKDSWNEATVISRASKATGKYPNCWKIKERDGTTKSINFDKVHSWKCTETKSVNDVTEVDDANTIHKESTPEKHTIGKVLLSPGGGIKCQVK